MVEAGVEASVCSEFQGQADFLGRNSWMLLALGCVCQVAKSCPTLCNAMNCSPLRFSVLGSPGRNTQGLSCPPPARALGLSIFKRSSLGKAPYGVDTEASVFISGGCTSLTQKHPKVPLND